MFYSVQLHHKCNACVRSSQWQRCIIALPQACVKFVVIFNPYNIFSHTRWRLQLLFSSGCTAPFTCWSTQSYLPGSEVMQSYGSHKSSASYFVDYVRSTSNYQLQYRYLHLDCRFSFFWSSGRRCVLIIYSHFYIPAPTSLSQKKRGANALHV